MGWTERPMVGFDTETTGVDVDADRIVTAAVVRRENGVDRVTRWLIDPGIEIPDAATAVHGVTTEHARAHGRAPREALDEIASHLATAAVEAEPIVAFNAAFDLPLLDAELRRNGLPTLHERLGHPVRNVLDPLVLDRDLDRFRRGKRRLADVCAHYGVAAEGLHSADADVTATLDVLAAMAEAFPRLAESTPGELHDRQVTAHRRWAESYNTWRRSRGASGPDVDACWPTPPSATHAAAGAIA